jgi:hypothetical protein
VTQTLQRADLDNYEIDRIAREVREQLCPGLKVGEALPLRGVRTRFSVAGLRGRFDVWPGQMASMPSHIWGVTCFTGVTARLWFHRLAWVELGDEVPRSRWSAGHEIGHVVLHADALRMTGDAHESPRMEWEANRFCAHLLAPDAGVQSMWTAQGAPAAEAVAERFGLGLVAASYRLNEVRTAL